MFRTLSRRAVIAGLTLVVSACLPSLGNGPTPATELPVAVYNDTFEDAYIVALPCGNAGCPMPIGTVTARNQQVVRVPRRLLQPGNQLTLGYRTAPGRDVQLIGMVVLEADQVAVLTVGQVSTLRVVNR